MTWSARLRTLAERERSWQVLCLRDYVFTPPASWFSGIDLHASLGLCGSHQQSRGDLEKTVTNPCRIIKGLYHGD